MNKSTIDVTVEINKLNTNFAVYDANVGTNTFSITFGFMQG